MRLPPRILTLVAALTLIACTGAAQNGADQGGAGQDDAGGADEREPIVVGALTSFTGPFTPWGVQARAGMQLAADEINDAGGVDGRLVELVEADDQNNVDEGVSAFERMVEQDGVLAVGGVISSSVGVAVAEVAEELETPLLVVKAGSPDVLTRESRYTFRTCLPAAPMTARPVAQYAEENDVERVGAIVADYAWGQAVRAALEDEFAASDVELLVEVAPVDASDFTPYLRELQAFGPSIIVATGHPPGTGSITVQAAALGLDAPVTGPWAALATVVESVGDVAFDGYADYACVDFSSPGYQELAVRFAAESEFDFMEGDAVAGYAIVRVVADAVAAGADDPTAVAEHLHANEFDVPGYSHVLSWTAWGELAASQPTLSIIREQAPPAGINDGAGWYPEVISTAEPIEPHEPD